MDAGPCVKTTAVPLRIVVDATEIVREGLGVLLSASTDRVVVLPRGNRQRPDVGLFDPVTQPRASLRSSSGLHAPLVALVWDDTLRSTTRARLLGASQILRINAPVKEVVAAIEEARRAWTTPVEPSSQAPAGDVLFTSREAEILSMICRGHSNTEIAEMLYLSINSVKTYIRTTYRKIGVTRRSRAVLWGIDHGY